MLNQFNEGGSHETNPLGGIPMGTDNQGTPNTVEQGETMKDSFVYSNRIILTPDVISQFNLPKSLTGKTVAEATKVIDKKFNGRNDRISKSTQKSLLDRAAQAQESIKAKQEQLTYAQQLNSQEVPDMMNGQIPQGMEQFQPQEQMYRGGYLNLRQNKMLLGGDRDKSDSITTSSVDINNLNEASVTENDTKTNNGMSGSTMGAIGAGLGAIGTGLSSMKQQNSYYDPVVEKKDRTTDTVSKTKDTVAGAISTVFPIAGLFRGIEKAGQGLGDAIGGDAGNYVKYAFSPDEAIMRANQDPDIKTSDKILGTILPFHAAKMSRKAEQRRQEEARFNEMSRDRSKWYNDFADGGDLNGDPTNPATKRDSMDVQKYSKRKIDQLLKAGYKQTTNFSGKYSNIHDENQKALLQLQDDKKKGVIRRVINEKGQRLQKVYEPEFYQKPHETNPNQYYNQESIKGMGVVNPNLDYLLFDKRIVPNQRKQFINPETGDGVEVYGYDFGEKYDQPKKVYKSGVGTPVKKPTSKPTIKKTNVNLTQGKSPVTMGYQFAMGGNINKYYNGGPLTEEESNLKNYFPYGKFAAPSTTQGTIDDQTITSDLVNQYMANKQPNWYDKNKPFFTTDVANSNISEKDRKKLNINTEKIGQGLNTLGRLAPAIMNYAQLRKLKKEGYDTVTPIHNDQRFNPEYVDERQLQNIAQNEMNNQINALSEAGLSKGQLVNAMLAAGLNKNKALSDAYMNAEAQNRATNLQGQQFNLGVTESNIGRNIDAQDKTAANKGRFRSELSAGNQALAQNIGDFFKERTNAKSLEKALGYNIYGEYAQDPNSGAWFTLDGKPVAISEVIKSIKEGKTNLTPQNKKKLGGSLMIKNK